MRTRTDPAPFSDSQSVGWGKPAEELPAGKGTPNSGITFPESEELTLNC